MTCVSCGMGLNMATAVRIEISSPTLFVIQYACEPCGAKMARAVVPAADRPLAWGWVLG